MQWIYPPSPPKPQFELSPPCLNFGAAPKPAEVSGLCVIHYKRLLVVILTVEFSRQIFFTNNPFLCPGLNNTCLHGAPSVLGCFLALDSLGSELPPLLGAWVPWGRKSEWDWRYIGPNKALPSPLFRRAVDPFFPPQRAIKHHRFYSISFIFQEEKGVFLFLFIFILAARIIEKLMEIYIGTGEPSVQLGSMAYVR